MRCSPIPPITRDDLPELWAPFGNEESVCGRQGYGEFRLSFNGKRAKTSFDMQWHGDSDFTVNMYSPFGGLIASIGADSTGVWTVAAGNSVYNKQSHDRVSIREASVDLPFSYAEFLHFFLGVFPDRAIGRKKPDSLVILGKKTMLVWLDDSIAGKRFAVTAIINRKHSAVTDVIYREMGAYPWEVTFSSLAGGYAKEIHFKDHNNNYFYVNYERLVFLKSGQACRRGNR
jgi:hypothetical protein